VAMELPLAIILGAILIDLCCWLAQRKRWPKSTLLATLAVAALVGSLPVTPMDGTISLQLVQHVGTPGLLVTILFGSLGVFIGAWFGQRMGVSMQQVEGEA